MTRAEAHQKLRHLIVFAFLGTFMFVSDLVMEALPNIHLISMMTMVCTIVYRWRALFPIYIYVFLTGVSWGFSTAWIPYLYIWTVLWAVTMLLPGNMNVKIAAPVYTAVCALHGILFGTLYAPVWAIMAKLSFKSTLAWIAAGLPYDALMMVGNIVASLLIIPLVTVLKKLEKIR